MKTKLLALSFALSCAFGGSAIAMTQVEYKAEKDRVSGEYKPAKDKMWQPERQRQRCVHV